MKSLTTAYPAYIVQPRRLKMIEGQKRSCEDQGIIGIGGELKPSVKRWRTETVMEPDTCENYRNLNGVSGVEYNDVKQSLSNSSGDSSGRLFDVPYIGCEPNQTAERQIELEPDMDTVTGPTKIMPYRHFRFYRNPNISLVLVTMIYTISRYDVDIEFQASQLPQDIPYISLMSKSTRQRITGHSLLVEVLNDSVSHLSLIGSECISSSMQLEGLDVEIGFGGKIQKSKIPNYRVNNVFEKAE
ncbi:hypothetical protein Tco_1274431 [Tanacetum coccineum]